MKLAIIPLAAVLLAGCAAPLTVTGQEMAAASNWDVCRYTTMGGTLAPAAQGEANRRALDCAPIYNALAAQRQSEAAALNQAAQFFAPRPAAPSVNVNCTSYRRGNTVQTDCR
jgi:hypothetical protein